MAKDPEITVLPPPTPEQLAAIRAHSERRLSATEFNAYVEAASKEEDRLDLITWFCRRYPTPAARLAYARRHELTLRRTMPWLRRTTTSEEPVRGEPELSDSADIRAPHR